MTKERYRKLTDKIDTWEDERELAYKQEVPDADEIDVMVNCSPIFIIERDGTDAEKLARDVGSTTLELENWVHQDSLEDVCRGIERPETTIEEINQIADAER